MTMMINMIGTKCVNRDLFVNSIQILLMAVMMMG